ncbi:MAG: MFS transporter [Microbacteriaceae bacterium]
MPTDTEFRIRSIVLPTLAPTLLFAIGEGAIIPVLPAIAAHRHASLAGAGLVAAMIMLGTLLGDLPSGRVIHRIGERRAMIAACLVAAAGLLLALAAPNAWLLAAGILLVGIATAIFALARHAFLATAVPLSHRARALATLGGTFRLGYFIGPFLGAALIGLTGWTECVFLVHLTGIAGALLLLVLQRDPSERIARLRGADDVGRPAGLLATIRANRRVHATIGLGAMSLSALRASRGVVLPLWAVSIGIDEVHTSLIVGLAGAIDVALFYLGGQLMDRFGRAWTVVPSTLGLALCFLVLAVSRAAADPVAWFVGVAVACSLANGLGAGILMTIGADLADPRSPATFLSAWRFQTDTGQAGASLVIAGVTAALGLPVAVAVMGVIGLAGAGMLWRHAPRTPRR